jgi:hypothetical protein
MFSLRTLFISFGFVLIIILGGLTLPVISRGFAQTTEQTEKAAVEPEDLKVSLFSEQDILTHLENIQSWQKDLRTKQATPTSAREILLSDALHQYADQTLAAAFDFARAQTNTLIQSPANVPEDDERNSDNTATPQATDNLRDMARRANNTVSNLQTQLTALDHRITRASLEQRSILHAQRNKLKSEINLAKAQQDLLSSIVKTIAEPEETEKDTLLYKINNLARTAGLLTDDKAIVNAVSKVPVSETPETPTSENEPVQHIGLLGLTSSILDAMRQKSSMIDLRQQTKDLRNEAKDTRNDIRDALKTMILSGNDLRTTTQYDITEITKQSADLDKLTEEFRALSSSVIPLGQLISGLENSSRVIKEWQSLLDLRLTQSMQKLIVKLTILGVTLMIPFILSEILKRMTNRYVQDKRRQRQLRLLRHFGLIAVLVLIIVFNLTTEIGSLATFIGFLAAGLAVALQNILLSLVAHFFYFGRYGIRTGDRVTVGGVTGDVTQIGMVRLYLAEINTKIEEPEPTGRIVTFPNAILFQNQAFYKHMRS